MSAEPRDLAASVRQRLLNLSRERREVFDLTLTRYGIERLLYRLTRSPYREQFVLKGAALFVIWGGAPHRATRDVDLLGRRLVGVESVERVFRELCLLPVEPDGLELPPESVKARRIHEGQGHEGVRGTLTARLGQARIALQVDVGFGSAVVPGPVEEVYPTLLPFPAPRLLAYPREVSVSEKFHAMVALGMASSRLKDYYDVWVTDLAMTPFTPACRGHGRKSIITGLEV